jgi:hypothetical protein
MPKLSIKSKQYINVNIELYRGKIYCNILNFFINMITKKFGTKIFNIKKTYQKTLTNLLSSWMFNLYSDYPNSEDPFFPDNFTDVTILKKTILDFCKYDTTIIINEVDLDNLLLNLTVYINDQIIKLNNYQSSQVLVQSDDNARKITKSIIVQKRNEKNINFYKFFININYLIKDVRLKNILENILIPIDVYKKMSNHYIGDKDLLDIYVWAIVFRYQLLGSNNHQLGVLPRVINDMNKDYNLNFECFASAINFTQTSYCSIYYDLEYYFGSCGSFFNLIPSEGTYSCNPPYQKEIIYKTIYKIFDHLKASCEKNLALTFIITMPIWDIEGQKILNDEAKIDYGEFNIISDIKTSEYFRGLRMISKNDFSYLDHNFKLLKNKTIQNTYIIILSTVEINIDYIMNYNFYEE